MFSKFGMLASEQRSVNAQQDVQLILQLAILEVTIRNNLRGLITVDLKFT